MIAILVFALLLNQSFGFIIPKSGGCNIDVFALKPEPIVVTTDNEFIYANPEDKSIKLNAGDTIIVSCPGSNLTVNGAKYETVEATCVSGTTFTVNNKEVNFSTLKCSKNPFHTARYTGQTCEQNGREIEIGFALDDDSFAREIRICFDAEMQSTLYSTYKLTKSIVHHESNVSRPSFIQDDFYDVGGSVNYLYVRDNQRATINDLLGLSPDSTKYIQNGNDFFLARGHFTAKADFVYGPQQLGTFHYVNVAPQWQTFNGGNWNTAEMDTRSYAQKNKLDLEVYTGSYGVATLTHAETGEEVELYLYVDGNKRGIAVPKFYWKVVYNPETNQGVALVGVNNPYLKDMDEILICEDISDQIDWLSWKATDITLGYSYACTVDDLRSVVPHIPDFPVDSLLV